MKTLGYVRVSLEKQVEGVSLDNQKARIRSYCEYRGYELIETIEDAGISGGKNKGRQGFNDLLDKLETGEYSVLVLYSLERLSRDMLTLLALERLLDEYDVELHTVEGQIDTSSPDGFMNFAMKSFLGEMERRQVKYRTKKAMEHMKKQNSVVGAVPYGYKRHEDSLVAEPYEQRTIEVVNELYTKVMNLSAICESLTAKGIMTRNGKPFTSMQVKRLIGGYKTVWSRKASKLSQNIREFITSIA